MRCHLDRSENPTENSKVDVPLAMMPSQGRSLEPKPGNKAKIVKEERDRY